jgi:hypothetical protein
MIRRLLGDIFRKKKIKLKKRKKMLTKEECKDMCLRAKAYGTCPKVCHVCAYNYELYQGEKNENH